MKIWLSKNSEISLRRQLVAQITLGIASGDLPPGARVPSTRALASRFRVHANTVGAAYQELLEKGLIEFRKGSGFYVCAPEKQNEAGEQTLDALVAEFFRRARTEGFSDSEIEAHLRQRSRAQTARTILVIERNANLLAILIEEIRSATDFPVVGVGPEEFQNERLTANTIVAAMAGEKAVLDALLPSEKARVLLTARSVSGSMKDETRPGADDLIAVASGWNDFLELARTVLVAANVEADSILLRSTGGADWQVGLGSASMIICDVLTAKKLPGDSRVRPFPLISDQSLGELVKTVS